jgi:hypothetical protein
MGHFGGRTRCSPSRVMVYGADGWEEIVRRRPTHDEIARLAYCYWEDGGCRHGRALDDWLRAERDLAEGRG